jgi:hypothetical protein
MPSSFKHLIRQWHTLRAGAPGTRFQRLLENRCRERGLLCNAWRNRMLAISILLGVAGLAAMSLLSPWGAAIVAISIVLGGRESPRVAEWLDLADARIKEWQRYRRYYRR